MNARTVLVGRVHRVVGGAVVVVEIVQSGSCFLHHQLGVGRHAHQVAGAVGRGERGTILARVHAVVVAHDGAGDVGAVAVAVGPGATRGAGPFVVGHHLAMIVVGGDGGAGGAAVAHADGEGLARVVEGDVAHIQSGIQLTHNLAAAINALVPDRVLRIDIALVQPVALRVEGLHRLAEAHREHVVAQRKCLHRRAQADCAAAVARRGTLFARNLEHFDTRKRSDRGKRAKYRVATGYTIERDRQRIDTEFAGDIALAQLGKNIRVHLQCRQHRPAPHHTFDTHGVRVERGRHAHDECVVRRIADDAGTEEFQRLALLAQDGSVELHDAQTGILHGSGGQENIQIHGIGINAVFAHIVLGAGKRHHAALIVRRSGKRQGQRDGQRKKVTHEDSPG